MIGERTAESVKMEIGYAYEDHEEQEMDIRGRDMVTGLPKTITISSQEIYSAIKESLERILEAIRATLETCPPELSGDIVDHGIVLTGGGALLKGMKDWIVSEIDVHFHIETNLIEVYVIRTTYDI